MEDETQVEDTSTTDETQATTPPAKAEKTFTQAELNAILAREKAKREEAAAQAKREADEAKLTEQNEFKTLAEQRKVDLEKATGEVTQVKQEAESHKAKAERYEAALNAYATEQRKDLPESVTALLDKLPVDEQLEWLAKNKSTLQVVAKDKTGPPPTPRGNNAGKTAEETAERAKRVELQYRNQF